MKVKEGNLVSVHALKAYGGSNCVAPHVFNLGRYTTGNRTLVSVEQETYWAQFSNNVSSSETRRMKRRHFFLMNEHKTC